MSLEELHPYFLGPYGENADVLEDLVTEFLRDHVYWRRNFHPESTPPIPTSAQYRDDYVEVIARLRREMQSLSADLKKSVPWFSPRYIGHMASDLLLPGLIAHLVTTLYNPNNVAEEAAPATVDKEIEVGFQLAEMFGFETDPDARPGRPGQTSAWGHLTSGGTVANYEAVRNLMALKFYPLAAASAVEETGVELGAVGPLEDRLAESSGWQLVNLSVDEVVAFRHALSEAVAERSHQFARKFHRSLQQNRFEAVGAVEFFRTWPDLKPPVILAAQTAHYSWPKAMKVLGLGRSHLRHVDVDQNMRMDVDALEDELEELHEERRPVLGLVGILGTTEFGTVDPIGSLVEARDRWAERGLQCPIHVDAAWGGYLASVFRGEDGGFVERERLWSEFRYFPSRTVYDAFDALSEVDSITVDPHKLGYVPYPAGAYVGRNAGMIDFVTEHAPYAFSSQEQQEPTLTEKLSNLGQYILEGSKPGASAASVHVVHNVMPLHTEAFGSMLKETVRASEYFFDMVDELASRLEGEAVIEIPFEPDCNLVCVAVNPAENESAGEMNRFVRGLYDSMRVDSDQPIQNKAFFVSSTALSVEEMDGEHLERLTEDLGLDPSTLVDDADGSRWHDDHVLLLRNTLMNPWLMFEEGGRNYVDRYLEFLERLIRERLTDFSDEG